VAASAAGNVTVGLRRRSGNERVATRNLLVAGGADAEFGAVGLLDEDAAAGAEGAEATVAGGAAGADATAGSAGGGWDEGTNVSGHWSLLVVGVESLVDDFVCSDFPQQQPASSNILSNLSGEVIRIVTQPTTVPLHYILTIRRQLIR
jgi:hypothetical protein